MALSNFALIDPPTLIEYGVESTNHTFAIKKTQIPAGIELLQHVHEYGHHSLLVSGKATVSAAGNRVTHIGPELLFIPAGVEHKVEAHTDCEWWCMHEIDDDGNIRL